MMNMIGYLFVFLTVTMLLLGQQIREDGMDLQNYTNRLQWDSETYQQAVSNVTFNLNSTAINGARVKAMIAKTVDWAGYMTYEWGKISLEWGYNHPEHNYRFVWNLLRYLVYIWIFVLIIPILAPLSALLYLIVKGMIILSKKVKLRRKNNATSDKQG